MNKIKQIKCALTRHYWQLQFTHPVMAYEENMLPRDERYCYQCQVCGMWDVSDVINLDNTPGEAGSQGLAPPIPREKH